MKKINVLIAKNWTDYQLLDCGNGKRLERYGTHLLSRPDPQCLWKPSLPQKEWEKADAIFIPAEKSSEKGRWKIISPINNKWLMRYKNITFRVKLTPFKHTGVFPEQSNHWEFIQEKIEKRIGNGVNEEIVSLPKILNLFGYTGISSLVAADAGAKVTHVDASFPTIGWARENQKLSSLENKPIRWILDDVLKFCQRELKRGSRYDGIIMDPPIYGHGPHGETWTFQHDFPQLVQLCSKLLSQTPLFFIVNTYAVTASSLMLENVLADHLNLAYGILESGELILEDYSGKLLSTGIFTRWSLKD